MINKRVLGLDLGSRTLGIALSDSLGMIASGLETYKFKDNDYGSALRRVREICQDKQVGLIVLGLPKHMNNDVGDKANISIKFKSMIENEIGIKVVLLDERWSTTLAEKRLISANVSRKKRKEIIDKMAAVVILQDYLDSTGG